MSRWLLTVLFLIASFFLTHFIPFSAFFRSLDTMIHEFAHAAVTLLLSGEVMYIELYQDRSGVTKSLITRSWSVVPIGLAGYMIASLFAWLWFALYARGLQKRGLLIITTLAVLSLVFFVRNSYGISWLVGFIALTLVILLFGNETVIKWYYLLIAFLSLEESVSGPLYLLFLAVTRPDQAGDATLLGQATRFPPAFWGVWFSVFALWCAKRALDCFFYRRRKPRERQPVYS